MELGACRKWRFFVCAVNWYEIVCYGNMVTISDSFCMGNLRNYIVAAQHHFFTSFSCMSLVNGTWKLFVVEPPIKDACPGFASPKPQKFQPKRQAGDFFAVYFDCHVFWRCQKMTKLFLRFKDVAFGTSVNNPSKESGLVTKPPWIKSINEHTVWTRALGLLLNGNWSCTQTTSRELKRFQF